MPIRSSSPSVTDVVFERRVVEMRETSPLELFEALRVDGRGALLLETAGEPDGRSVLLPSPLLRLRSLRNTVVLDALSERGRRLLPSAAKRFELLGEVSRTSNQAFLQLPERPASTGRTDAERLRDISVLDAVRSLLTLIRAPKELASKVCVAGTFGYELVDSFEELGPRQPDPLEEDDLNLVLAVDSIEIDTASHRATVTVGSLKVLDEGSDATDRLLEWSAAAAASKASEPRSSAKNLGERATLQRRDSLEPEEYQQRVAQILKHIRDGDVFQTVLSRSTCVASSAEPLQVYRALRELNPSPYMFFFDLGEGSILGASPERCLRVQEGRIEIQPIAGTVPRGRNPEGEIDEELDLRLSTSLLLDPKELAEHSMLVDLARNDVARVSIPGTRRVRAPFHVERFSHVQHLVSAVTGELRPELDALDAYRACANMGTLTGAPKVRAMQILRQLEPTARGTYGGALGLLHPNGDFDSCIVIRSLRFKNGKYTVRAGAGIVAASDPEREYRETVAKASAPLRALELAESRRDSSIPAGVR